MSVPRIQKKLRLGEELVRRHKLSPEQLEVALASAHTAKMRLGEFLIDRGIVPELDVLDIISSQLSIPRYDASQYETDPTLRDLLPMRRAQQSQAAPLCVRDGILYLALLDAPDFNELFALEDLTNRQIEPVLCTKDEFERIFRIVYGEHTAFDAMMTEFRDDAESVSVVSEEESELIANGDAAPVIRIVNLILAEGVRAGASDVHINPEKNIVNVRYRIQGVLRTASDVPKNIGPALASRLKILANLDISVTRTPQDGRFSIRVDDREINVRLSTLPTIYGENIVMRLLDMSSRRIYTFPTLGMNPHDCSILEREVKKPWGMILSTGPTGSGKSTSLYSIIQMIKRDDINIITLEDPVEYRMDGIRQVQLNTKAGMTFASGLRSILRQDPDVVMVGEIRDEETARIAVQAALTGHLVLSTLHTNDAIGAVYRLMDMGVEPHFVTSVLLSTFAQRLVRTICPHCRTRYQPPAGLLARFGLTPDETIYYRGAGCPHCNGTGYAGRVGIFEVLAMTDDIRQALARGLNPQDVQKAARTEGFHSMREDAAEKIRDGRTTVEEALRVTMA